VGQISLIPNNSLSQVNIKGAWIGPEAPDPDGLVSYSWGGAKLQDPSQGLRVQLWKFTYENGKVYAGTDTLGKSELFALDGITELCGTFDQNMNYAVAFVVSGQAQFRWFDAVAAGFVTSVLPVGSITPMMTLDDNRKSSVPTSDIILTYVNNDNLYYRQQRDRYTTEYLLRAGVGGKILRVGMNSFYRLQWKLRVV
jgi:hypothetical protein